MKIIPLRRIFVCVLIVFSLCTAASGAGSITSSFDSGVDMWTGTGSGNFSFSSSGGNPGGFIRFDDSSGTSAEGWIYAPAKFLGNWSDWENQASISWDSLIIQKGGAGKLLEGCAIISGPGGSATFTSTECMTHTGWKNFSVPLNDSVWVVTEGSWPGILKNVTALGIRIESVNNTYGAYDVSGIDNIILSHVPEPATIVFFAFGLTLLKK